MNGVLRQTRANFPSRYVFSVVRLAPPSTPIAPAPCACWIRAISRATRAIASSYGSGAESGRRRRVAPERGRQAIGVRALEITLHAFRAQHAAVERELLPRLEADDLVVADLELDAALLAAEAAVRLDQPIGLDARRQPRARHRRQMRTEALDDAQWIDRELRHVCTLPLAGHAAATPPGEGGVQVLRHNAPCARPNSARRQRRTDLLVVAAIGQLVSESQLALDHGEIADHRQRRKRLPAAAAAPPVAARRRRPCRSRRRAAPAAETRETACRTAATAA